MKRFVAVLLIVGCILGISEYIQWYNNPAGYVVQGMPISID
jgi:hypothetical protein